MADEQNEKQDQSQDQNQKSKEKSAKNRLEELGFENLTKPGHGIVIIGGRFNKPPEH